MLNGLSQHLINDLGNMMLKNLSNRTKYLQISEGRASNLFSSKSNTLSLVRFPIPLGNLCTQRGKDKKNIDINVDQNAKMLCTFD